MPENIEELKKREKWFSTLYRITRDVNSTLSLKKCLTTIAEKVTQLLGVHMASLMLLDKEGKELRIEYATGLPEEIIKTTRIRIGKDITVSSWVVEKGEPLLIEDIEKDACFPMRDSRRYSTKSLLSVPLKVKGKVIGVLNVNNKAGGKPFIKEDLELLSAFANEAAVAIENSRLYEELMQFNKNLKEINQHKSEFIAHLSHRLRTPLVTSKYFTSLLRDELGSDLSDKQREYLLVVEENIYRLTRLIDNLLDLAKIESGKVVLNKRLLSIVDLAKKAALQFRVPAWDKNITLKTHLPSRFPKIYIDEEKILEVFNILLDNALKFTLSGGKVTVQVRKKDELAEVSVRDTGRGIAKRDLDKLFIKFSQVRPAVKTGVKGSGLGLSISREIIEMHKGRIWAESQFGKGSNFIFTLPLYKPLEFFKERLDERITEAGENIYSFSLIILRIVNLDTIKKRLGNQQYLKLLKDLESITEKTLRLPEDEVMLPKDDRLVILCKTDKRGAYVVAERFKKILVRHKFSTPKGAVNLSIHFDVLTYPEDSLSPEEFMRKAQGLIMSG